MINRIETTKKFRESFKVRIKGNTFLAEAVHDAIATFLDDPYHAALNNHELIDNHKSRRAFTVLPDLRIIYVEMKNYYLFFDIDSHEQVY